MFSSKQRKVLLVDGYIRENEKSLYLSNVIPKPIYAVIFEYQLLLDVWNKELNDKHTTISDDGSCIDITPSSNQIGGRPIKATHTVKYEESFKWTLEIMKVDGVMTNRWIFIALVPDKDDIGDNPFQWYKKGGIAWLASTGVLGGNGATKKYSEKNQFVKEGDILQIKFNYSQRSTLHFIANDKDLGDALITNDSSKPNKFKINVDEDVAFRLMMHVPSSINIKLRIDGTEI